MESGFSVIPSSRNLGLWISVISVPFILLTQEPHIIKEPSRWALRSTTIRSDNFSLPPPEIPTALENKKPKFMKSKFTRIRDPESELLYKSLILTAASSYRIDPDLVKAIILVESRFKPTATSKKGAKGLMQLMPETARELGVRNILDPQENINAGVKYFRRLLDRFGGDVELALAAYNAGYGKVILHNGIPPYKDTQIYVEEVFEFYTFYKIEMLTERPAELEFPAEYSSK